MDKQKLIEKICTELESNLTILKAAAQQTYEAATGEESRAENQYDTRAVEASYLASAQSKRVSEIEASISSYRFLEMHSFNDDTPIGATALVELVSNGKKSRILIVPAGGGLSVQYDSKVIQVLTPQSPLGEALIGLRTGDVAVVEKDNRTLEYEILSVE